MQRNLEKGRHTGTGLKPRDTTKALQPRLSLKFQPKGFAFAMPNFIPLLSHAARFR